MDIIENIREENSGIVTAAVYVSCDKCEDSEKLITEQLDSINEIVESEDIIVVDKYIDADGTNEGFQRLIKDIDAGYFDIVLICGDPAGIFNNKDFTVIDVLKAH